MPYKSQVQRRYMHEKHPDIARRWDKESPYQKGLPERIHSQHSKALIIEKQVHKRMGIK